MTQGEQFAKRVFQIAGWYGLLVMIPQYFMESRIGQDMPPAITHPEYFYGFNGLTIAWQLGFLAIATNPKQYRLFMPIAMFEKISWVVATVILYAMGRLHPYMLAGGMVDAIILMFFIISYRKLSNAG